MNLVSVSAVSDYGSLDLLLSYSMKKLNPFLCLFSSFSFISNAFSIFLFLFMNFILHPLAAAFQPHYDGISSNFG